MKVLLDTHVIVWLDNGGPMRRAAIEAIERARLADQVLVSPISFWEISRLAALDRLRFDLDPMAWARRFMGQRGVAVAELTAEIAMAAATLPDLDHRDPADRLLISSARTRHLTLVTRDRAILAYGARGYLEVLRC